MVSVHACLLSPLCSNLKNINTLKLHFVLALCYYSIHHLGSFTIAVNNAGQYQHGVHAILSVGSDTSAIVMYVSEKLFEKEVRHIDLCTFCLRVLIMYKN